MGRRGEHSREELEGLVHQAGMALVREGGVEALTARGIAGKIGYTPGMLYSLYDDLDALAAALAGRELKGLAEELKGIRGRGGGWVQQVWDGTDRVREIFRGDPALRGLVAIVAGTTTNNEQFQSGHDAVRRELAELFRPLTDSRGAAEDRAAIFLGWVMGAVDSNHDARGDLLVELLVG